MYGRRGKSPNQGRARAFPSVVRVQPEGNAGITKDSWNRRRIQREFF
jgi:hypothetical protein